MIYMICHDANNIQNYRYQDNAICKRAKFTACISYAAPQLLAKMPELLDMSIIQSVPK